MRIIFRIFSLSLLILILTACSKDTDVIELKLGTKMPDETIEGKAFNEFARLVEEKTNGKIKVHVYPAEQLGTGTTQIDNMVLGTQDMYSDGLAFFRDFDRRVDASSVPYLFENFEHFQRYNLSDKGKEIEKNLIDKGVRILNTDRNFVRGPYRVLLSTKPVKELEDLQGLKIRSHESAIYADAWKHLGTNPIVLAWTETYLALRQGTVDAVTSPISLVKGMNFAEVAPYMTVIDEYPQDVVIVIAEKSYEKLSDEHQKILEEAANEAGDFATSLLEKEIQEDIDFMKNENGIEIIEINKEKWSDKMQPFLRELEEKGELEKGTVDYINSLK